MERTIDLPSPIVRAPPMLSAVLVVVMLLDRVAAPDVENPPGAVMAPVAPRVNIPELVTATAPVAVKLLFTANAVPFKVAEPTFTVLEKVVAPVAVLVWVSAPVMLMVLEKRRAAECVMVRVVNAVASPNPTAPVKVTAPVVLTVRVSAEFPVVPLVVPVTVNV